MRDIQELVRKTVKTHGEKTGYEHVVFKQSFYHVDRLPKNWKSKKKRSFRRNFKLRSSAKSGNVAPFPQELLDCVSDGDGEPLDSLEVEHLWRLTFVWEDMFFF